MFPVLIAVRRALLSLMRRALKSFGYSIIIFKQKKWVNRSGLNLNVGAGDYVIDGFVSLDMYSDHYYKSKSQFLKKRVLYDLRKDNLPYGDQQVDSIYASHVIEHVEPESVNFFFKEAYRCLKIKGVLRVVCPDARFLFEVSHFSNDYWRWRESALKGNDSYELSGQENSFDYLIREIATPRMTAYRHHTVLDADLISQWPNMSYQELRTRMSQDLSFREDFPGDHISFWDFESLFNLGKKEGFQHIVNSKFQGSVSSALQGNDIDLKAPQMSLYVDFVK